MKNALSLEVHKKCYNNKQTYKTKQFYVIITVAISTSSFQRQIINFMSVVFTSFLIDNQDVPP